MARADPLNASGPQQRPALVQFRTGSRFDEREENPLKNKATHLLPMLRRANSLSQFWPVLEMKGPCQARSLNRHTPSVRRSSHSVPTPSQDCLFCPAKRASEQLGKWKVSEHYSRRSDGNSRPLWCAQAARRLGRRSGGPRSLVGFREGCRDRTVSQGERGARPSSRMRERSSLGDMRPGTIFARSDDCDLKGCWSQTRPPKTHAPCCEIGFIGKAKGIS